MKKFILLLVLPLFCSNMFGQQYEEVEKLIEEGVVYHDKRAYEKAIEKYDAALQLDEDNIYALTEKALTLFYMKKYDEAIIYCRKVIEKHADTGNSALASVYVTYGNAYDGLQKPEKAIELYDEGIKQFPDYYQLYFNKGITLVSGMEKYDEAILCFQQSAFLNPSHAGSQNAIAWLLDITGKRIPALMAYSRFLVLEPEGVRAERNFANLQKIMKGNVEKTGKKSITININPDMLDETDEKVENNFSMTDLLLAMDAALDYDKKYKKKSEVEKFIRKFESVCASLKEAQADNVGFYWEYYAPYFIEMEDKGFIETFAHIAFATSGEANVVKWLVSHEKEIKKFYDWSSSFVWNVKEIR